MFYKEVMRVALQALRNHRLRSLLTMLGIIIGVAAMITMVNRLSAHDNTSCGIDVQP